jgi:uncharacterized SAM-dependent methyltransferase
MPAYYKKQVEIAREFGISEGTVTNWIKGAISGKNNIQLHKVNDDQYIIKNEHNRVVMLNLAQNGRKFRSEESEVDLVVKDELYEVMSPEEVISLTKSLILKSEIPVKYVYLGDGAELWDKFYQSLNKFESYGQESYYFLWQRVLEYCEPLLKKFSKVNLIDIGPGNFEPAEFWLDYIKKNSTLSYYTPIDISNTILEKVVLKFKKKYPTDKLSKNEIIDKNYFAERTKDLDKDSLEDVVNKVSNNFGDKSLNIFLFLGGTFGIMENQVRTLLNIKDAMLPDDILIIDNAYDTLLNRASFAVSQSKEYNDCLLFVSTLLGIEEAFYEQEFKYNEATQMREYNLILNRNLNIHFKKYNIIAELKKGQRINVWKHRRDTFEFISENIKQAGMELQFIAKHPTDPEVIYMSKLV